MKNVFEICNQISNKLVTVVNKVGIFEMTLADAVNQNQLEGFPLTQIIFAYPNDAQSHYWERPWIKACTESQKSIAEKRVYINIDDDILSINNFSNHHYGPNFNTDPLRLIFICLFGNAFYMDSDVFISDPDRILSDIKNSPYDKFTYGQCTGNFCYNNRKNSPNVLLWIDWYDNIDRCIGDIEAWMNYGYKIMKSYDRPDSLCHFAIFYPYFSESAINNYKKTPIQIIENVEPKSYNHIRVPKEAEEAVIQYLKYKGAILEYPEKLEVSKAAAIFI